MEFLTEAIKTTRDLSLLSAIIRIIVTVIIAGVLGYERGSKNRPAGLRTHILVALGACIVMMTNQYVYQAYETGDLVRMGAQVVSGIGFLGAGTIIVTRKNQIKGLTTAAGLWASACVGLAAGLGLYEVAVVGAFVIYFALKMLHRLDVKMKSKAKELEIYVELKDKTSLADFIRYAHEKDIELSDLQMEHDNFAGDDSVAFIVTVKSNSSQSHPEILTMMREIKSVVYIEVL
jgi:putative Mg2+ transporter-C (MgtC) family protein